MKPKIAIIGAGWAGLTAAMQLSSHAHVSVFEASKQAGGRARGLETKQKDFDAIDNGQHLLLGAYHQVFAVRQQAGVAPTHNLVRLPSQWHLLDGLDFQTKHIPAPLHALLGIFMAKNWHWSDKTRWLQDAYALNRAQAWLKQTDMSVLDWFEQRHIPKKHIDEFWKPLVLATMNTPLHLASLRTLAIVINDGLLKRRQDSDFCLANVNLQDWFVEPVCRYLRRHSVNLHFQTRIQNLQKAEDGKHWLIDGVCFDRVIIATAPYHVLDVLGSVHAFSVEAYFKALTYSAITTVYLRYPGPLKLPHTIQGTAYGTSQWLIDRERLGVAKNEVAAIISTSEAHGIHDSKKWIDLVHQDLANLQAALPLPEASLVITEKRATVHATVNRSLPPITALNKQGIYLAGDYCHPDYPATLEGAVQSGQMTAAMCLADWKNI